ncbi:MAG TPA: DUF2785 domain-containing protein [Sphingorhabdus sp.]|jgi:hypothetical protein|nr:DUF2785 domain-containing protein [Sphingorhabdus sp.]
MDKAKLRTLKSANWEIAEPAARDRLVIELTQCLGSSDPVLRDEIAYEALYHYLRGKLVSDAAMVRLAGILQAQMVAPDADGFRRPFAAIALVEVARADRIKAFLTPEQRTSMLASGVAFMRSITDYRGFDPQTGYRHNVAHGADLMLQLALNPAFGKAELISIRDALAMQVAPKGQSYTTGESERLARPILFMAQRGVISEAEWTAWFAQVAGPGELGTWDNWFRSADGIARKHNVAAFLSFVHVGLDLSDNPGFEPLRAGVAAAIKSLP